MLRVMLHSVVVQHMCYVWTGLPTVSISSQLTPWTTQAQRHRLLNEEIRTAGRQRKTSSDIGKPSPSLYVS